MTDSEKAITFETAYPECDALGSDTLELQAFAASLALVNQLEKEGCTRLCASRQVYTSLGCMCLGSEKPNE
jgi:hypothetical protein